MDIAVAVGAVLVFCFGFVLLFGAPYVPTLKPQITEALDLLNLKPGQTMLELGSGDGRVLKAAAERGWKVVGYELNPILVIFSLWHTRKYRKNVRVVWGNAFTKKWPATDGIYVFVLEKAMPKLHTKIVQSIKKPVKVVSFAFKMPDEKIVGQTKSVFLYEYKPGK